MTTPLTPRQWAEKAFDGVEADESLFAAVERVIGEAMAAWGAQSDDLVARLRAVENGGSVNSVTHWHRNPDGHEAADRIEQLEAEVSELREALEPFSGIPIDDAAPDEWRASFDWYTDITNGDLRMVNKVLAKP
jgi:hypothetical protein